MDDAANQSENSFPIIYLDFTFLNGYIRLEMWMYVWHLLVELD